MKRLIITLLLSPLVLLAMAGEHKNIDEGWRFILADSAAMAQRDFDDSTWRLLDLPHDWAIEGDFLPTNPSGASGGALPGGVAWYRKALNIKPTASQYIKREGATQRYFLDFDGVYMNSRVYFNGHELGYRPYGYSSFRYEITPYLRADGKNVVAVRVDNSDQPNSRWYSGCGIYRHVWLTEAAPVSVSHWGTYITTELKNAKKAVFTVNVDLESTVGTPCNNVVVRNTLLDAQGTKKGVSEQKISIDKRAQSTQHIALSNPRLWSTATPYIYKVRTEVIVDGQTVDTYTTTTGVRTFKFDPKTGFSLNGKAMKINGVCQHHDMGCLGAALNEDALYRQLRMLKDMGCNAIRCSHNPPAPELLNMCDTMGLLVMDESFDMWRKKKSTGDYARFFDEWFERDLTDLVVRDRNHPCIIMWSIGNEVLEQWSSADADTLSIEQANLILNFGHSASSLAKDGEMSVNSLLTKRLVDIVKQYDKTRPVTAGCNEPDPGNHLFKSGALDIIGFNYHHQWIKDVPQNFPGKPFIVTESVSALETRGFYRMPADSIKTAPKEWWIPYADPSYACSAYDNEHVPWGSTHETTWDVVKHTPWCSGQFIWTGWDYIGEPTPYAYPARSSYFGIIDLAGFPKDIYYMYQSEWTDKTVLHLLPHWNWIDSQPVDVWCYYNNADEVELYLNGKSLGIRRKADFHQYHVAWQVPFERGELKAVSRKNGKTVATQIVRTAGAPDHIRLTADRTIVKSDGKSLAFITVEVVDKDGTVCPYADNQIFFTVEGQGRIEGVDNGSQTSLERFKADNRRAMAGKCLVVLRSAKQPGTLKLTAKAADLEGASVELKVE